jgi:pimeloyl-ACP methyl ester carboxylesterase
LETGDDTLPPVLFLHGTGGHAEAYSRCRNAKWTKWRSIVDVDLLDATDPAHQLVTATQRLRCRPDFAALDG